jgi:hypothetical protein
MKIQKSAIFLRHRNAQEVLEQERKYNRLSRLGWVGALLFLSLLLLATVFFSESKEYQAYTSLAALFLGPLASASLLMGMIYDVRAVDVTSAIRRCFATLARVLGMTEEELCSREPSEVEKTGKMLILNQAVNIQIFEDSVKELKIIGAAYLTNRIHDFLSDDKAEMKERLNSLHKALQEFSLTGINYDWAFEEARKIRS